jgi:uncharacterized protein
VGVLYACESGSRAWGFASPDSDWDVRFIYLHASDWYLSLIDWKEVIELPIEGNLDINGWDFRKSLKLLLKGNPVLFEWLASPIVYREDQTVMVRYRELAQHLFRPRRAFQHYLSYGAPELSGSARRDGTTEEVLVRIEANTGLPLD